MIKANRVKGSSKKCLSGCEEERKMSEVCPWNSAGEMLLEP